MQNGTLLVRTARSPVTRRHPGRAGTPKLKYLPLSYLKRDQYGSSTTENEAWRDNEVEIQKYVSKSNEPILESGLLDRDKIFSEIHRRTGTRVTLLVWSKIFSEINRRAVRGLATADGDESVVLALLKRGRVFADIDRCTGTDTLWFAQEGDCGLNLDRDSNARVCEASKDGDDDRSPHIRKYGQEY
ncbi:hypothetical protein GQ53DRAFT_765320 [Thozetella sp. PMI_491]|nr:hypothetical protein GQ53DRAFT_765320 [Thozetella sp. PMI_491]